MKVVQEDSVEEVLQSLKEGKVVAFPTDTVYGLLADATNKDVVGRVFQIKDREEGKSLPVFVKDIEMAKDLAQISEEQEKFLEDVWPGKVTVVLQSKGKLPEELEMDGRVALRIPDYELVNTILEKLNVPVTGTSANVSGKPSCQSAQEVVAQFKERKDQPDLVLNAGQLPESKPSTIIDITKKKHKIIRK